MLGDVVIQRFFENYPNLARVVGHARLEEGLRTWARNIQEESFLEERTPGWSRGFWNDVIAQIDHRVATISRTNRVRVLEHGLRTLLEHGGSPGSWPERLAADEAGYLDSVAELAFIYMAGRLGSLTFEPPGSASGRNYDIRIDIDGGARAHLEVKHRQPLGLGAVTPSVDRKLRDQLRPGLGEEFTTCVSISKNRLAPHELRKAVRAAKLALDEYRRPDESTTFQLEPKDLHFDFPERLHSAAWRAFARGKEARILNTEEFPCLVVDDVAEIHLDHDLVESLHFFPGIGGVMVWGAVEKLAPYSKSSLQSLGFKDDHDKPAETTAFLRLLRSVPGQLPVARNAIVAVCVEDQHQLEPVRLALLGEPFREGGLVEPRGGLFSESDWSHVAAAIAVHLRFDGQPWRVAWHTNPNAENHLEDEIKDQLTESLKRGAIES